MVLFNMLRKKAGWQEKVFGVILALLLALFASGVPKRIPCEAGEPFSLTDDMGVRVSFDAPVRRVVSLYAGHTENLVALGAGDRLVAISQADEAGIAGSAPRLGMKPGIEQIVALRPDLVLTRPMLVRAQSALYERLRDLGVKVLALDPPAWEEFPTYIEHLVRLAWGDDVSFAKRNEVQAIMARAPKADTTGAPKGVILITNGRTLATCTPDSWAAHVMRHAGLRNAAPDVRPISPGSVIAPFGAERLLASGGKIDAVLLQQGAMNSTSAADFMGDPRFSGMKAVRTGMVFEVSEADISRPSLLRLQRGIVCGLQELVSAGRDSR